MDAWEQLITGSAIESGDAWGHLIAQGGGGSAIYAVLTDGVQIEMSVNEIDVVVDQEPVEVTVGQQDITVTVDQSPLEVEI